MAAEAAAAITTPIVARFITQVIPASPEVRIVTKEERPTIKGTMEVPTTLLALAHLGTTYREPL